MKTVHSMLKVSDTLNLAENKTWH